MEGGGRSRSQQKTVKEIPKRIIISSSMHLDTKLHQTENAWKPQHKKDAKDLKETETEEGGQVRWIGILLTKSAPWHTYPQFADFEF